MLQCGAFDKAYEGYTMEYFFLFVIVKLIVFWAWLERDAF